MTVPRSGHADAVSPTVVVDSGHKCSWIEGHNSDVGATFYRTTAGTRRQTGCNYTDALAAQCRRRRRRRRRRAGGLARSASVLLFVTILAGREVSPIEGSDTGPLPPGSQDSDADIMREAATAEDGDDDDGFDGNGAEPSAANPELAIRLEKGANQQDTEVVGTNPVEHHNPMALRGTARPRRVALAILASMLGGIAGTVGGAMLANKPNTTLLADMKMIQYIAGSIAGTSVANTPILGRRDANPEAFNVDTQAPPLKRATAGSEGAMHGLMIGGTSGSSLAQQILPIAAYKGEGGAPMFSSGKMTAWLPDGLRQAGGAAALGGSMVGYFLPEILSAVGLDPERQPLVEPAAKKPGEDYMVQDKLYMQTGAGRSSSRSIPSIDDSFGSFSDISSQPLSSIGIRSDSWGVSDEPLFDESSKYSSSSSSGSELSVADPDATKKTPPSVSSAQMSGLAFMKSLLSSGGVLEKADPMSVPGLSSMSYKQLQGG